MSELRSRSTADLDRIKADKHMTCSGSGIGTNIEVGSCDGRHSESNQEIPFGDRDSE
jgi:hypothetical protein